MKLPKVSNPRSKLANEMENAQQLKEAYNPFKAHMEKVIEVKIYLNYNFHKNDIDDVFINDLEQEYAVQFLEKMQYLPTKQNISKILKLKPIEHCDFHLSLEQVRNKPIKLIHIYPNNKSEKKTKDKLKLQLSNEAFEEELQNNYSYANKHKEDPITQIAKRDVKKDEILLFQRENVDNMIAKAKDDIVDKQLYATTTWTNDKKFLEIDNIREKYLNPNNKNILETNLEEKMNAKAKFQNIDKARKKDILTDVKYEFPFLDVELKKEILDEVNQPMEIPVELIMKDINFILDNFPIEELIDIEDGGSAVSNGNGGMMNNTVGTFGRFSRKKNTTNRKQLYYKIKSVKRSDIIYVYKKIQTQPVYRIIGLTLNLLYWIVFGFVNRFQIDKSTKQFLYFKLLQEIQVLDKDFTPKKLFNKIYMPLLILIIRIECENIFDKKFKILFEDKRNKDKAMEKTNELITIIFDPHCYYNTFTIIGGNTAILKHKLSKKILPKYKSKTYVTSNLVDQLFTKFKSQKNVIHHKEKGLVDELDKEFDVVEWEREKKYIAESKAMFFKVLFHKINQNLKRRNLDPIFSVKKEEVKEIKEDVKGEMEDDGKMSTGNNNTLYNKTYGVNFPQINEIDEMMQQTGLHEKKWQLG